MPSTLRFASIVVGLAASTGAARATFAQSPAAQSAPRPPAALPASAGTPAAAVAPHRQSWTSDRMPLAVGDVVTIMLDEHVLATSNLSNLADDRRSRKLDAGLTMPQASQQGAFSTQSAGHSQSEGRASRANDFVGAISARVVAVSPTGLLQVQGTKFVALDKTTEEIGISGWIRPDDVSIDNTVESRRIADARLSYHSTGGADKPRSGIISRVLGWIWP